MIDMRIFTALLNTASEPRISSSIAAPPTGRVLRDEAGLAKKLSGSEFYDDCCSPLKGKLYLHVTFHAAESQKSTFPVYIVRERADCEPETLHKTRGRG